MDRTEEILSEIRSLREGQVVTHTELREFRAAQAQMCCNATKQRDDHHCTLYGNGKPGLVSTVQDLASKLNLLWAVAVAVGGLLLETIYRHLAGK